MPNKGGSTNELQIISSHACITGCADVACDGVRSNCNASAYRNPHQSTCTDRHTNPTNRYAHPTHRHPSPADTHARAANRHTLAPYSNSGATNAHSNPISETPAQSSGTGFFRHGL